MGRCFIQIIMGPAGSGKSTFCTTLQQHCANLNHIRRRRIHVANLDPAAETFGYDMAFDIRDLITVEDVMEELGLGPNGALIYCMEFLLENMDWLEDELNSFDDDELLLLDCPGQIELYTHVPVMKRIIEQMNMWGHNSRMASVFIVDATFVCDAPKFISGSLLSLSAMIALELPHINVLSKCDLVDAEKVESVLEEESSTSLWQREEYAVRRRIEQEEEEERKKAAAAAGVGVAVVRLNREQKLIALEQRQKVEARRTKHNRLTEAICGLLDDYSMVSFIPMNIKDEESIDHVLMHVDHTIQYGEEQEVRGAEQDDNVEGEES